MATTLDSTRLSRLQVGTLALAALALGVSIHAEGTFSSKTGQFMGTGATVGLSVVPTGSSVGTSSILQAQSIICNSTGGELKYNHCNIPLPVHTLNNSGAVIRRITYAVGNAPSANKISIVISTGAVNSGSELLNNFTTATGEVYVYEPVSETATGTLRWRRNAGGSGDVLRAIIIGTEANVPATSHTAKFTVEYNDTNQ